MSVIIANRQSFILVYSEDDLPQFNELILAKTEIQVDNEGNEFEVVVSVKTRDMNVLTSQIVGCAIRGDNDRASEILKAMEAKARVAEQHGDHAARMAAEYVRRVHYMLDNLQVLAPKYITAWQRDNSARERGRK